MIGCSKVSRLFWVFAVECVGVDLALLFFVQKRDFLMEG